MTVRTPKPTPHPAALALLAAMAIGPAAIAQTVKADAPAPITAPVEGPVPAATSVQPTTKPPSTVDLNPRPLGKPPAPKAAASRSETSAAAPTLTQGSFLRTALSLGVVLALIGVCALALRVLKRRGVLVGGSIAAGARAPSGVLETLGRYPLGRGQTLLLIKLDQRVLLIGQTAGTLRAGGGSLTTLCELSDSEDVASILLKAQDASDASAAARFEGMLREFDDRHGPREPAFETPASVALRPTRTPAAERSDPYAERVDVRNIPLVPVHTERRAQPQPPAAPQHAQPSESFGSLRERLSALRGEAHR